MKRRKKRSSRKMEFLKAAIVVALIGLVLRIFIFLPFKCDGADMENALYQGDYLIVSKLSYTSGTPQAGDLVVFEHPFKIGELKAGRVVAIEGQTVEIIDKMVYVDNVKIADYDNIKHSDSKILSETYTNRDYLQPVQVPAGAVYILCDNRDIAEDSRNFGSINVDDIRGRGMFVYWSWRPDPDAPEWESPYVIPAVKILFYSLFNFPSRLRWDRLGVSGN